MKQKAGFIMCDYAFNHNPPSKGVMAEIKRAAKSVVKPVINGSVGQVRIIERKV